MDTEPPRESMAPLTDVEQILDRGDRIAQIQDEMGLARAAAYTRTTSQADAMIRKHNLDPNKPDYFFQIGDWVKRKNYTANKFEYDWTGPYMIHRIGHPGTYWIKTPRGEISTSTINQRDLAPWLSKTVPNQSFFVEAPAEPTAVNSV